MESRHIRILEILFKNSQLDMESSHISTLKNSVNNSQFRDGK